MVPCPEVVGNSPGPNVPSKTRLQWLKSSGEILLCWGARLVESLLPVISVLMELLTGLAWPGVGEEEGQSCSIAAHVGLKGMIGKRVTLPGTVFGHQVLKKRNLLWDGEHRWWGQQRAYTDDQTLWVCFGTRETIGVRDEHLITKQF